MQDGHNIPSDDDDENDENMDDESRKARRKDWIKYSSSFSLKKKFSLAKGKMRKGTNRWTVTTIFSKIWSHPSLQSQTLEKATSIQKC